MNPEKFRILPDLIQFISSKLETFKKMPYCIINHKEESTICYHFKGTFHCIFCTIEVKFRLFFCFLYLPGSISGFTTLQFWALVRYKLDIKKKFNLENIGQFLCAESGYKLVLQGYDSVFSATRLVLSSFCKLCCPQALMLHRTILLV